MSVCDRTVISINYLEGIPQTCIVDLFKLTVVAPAGFASHWQPTVQKRKCLSGYKHQI